jgi:hypothetical protein
VYPRDKTRHLASKITATGKVSALCSDPPKAIRLSVATWVTQAKYVSCKKCLAILKERGADLKTHHVFAKIAD